jgi:hypothetical protein
MQHSAGQIAENESGHLVHAIDADRVEKFVCRQCKQNVFLRRGVKILKNGQPMIPHFAHSATNVIKCSGYEGGETIQHLHAKWCLANNIEDFRFIMQSCGTCQYQNAEYCVRFSKEDWNVVVEGQVAGTGTGKRPRRADVLVQMTTSTVSVCPKPWYALEVQYSHAVSAEKSKELDSVNCGVIEVLAVDVLRLNDMLQADKPCYLRNVHNAGRSWTCETCMDRVAMERTARWVDYEDSVAMERTARWVDYEDTWFAGDGKPWRFLEPCLMSDDDEPLRKRPQDGGCVWV